MLKKLLALLCFASVASAQVTYEKTTVSPRQHVSCTNGSTGARDVVLLSAAAAVGGNITLEGNCTINATITLISNTTFYGNGYTITAAAAANWASSTIRAALSAANSAVNVRIIGGRYDYTGSAGTVHILSFPSANVGFEVSGVTCVGSGDCVAMTGASYGSVHDSYATASLNSCWDMWGGSNHISVHNNHCTLTATAASAYCVLITGFNTDNSAAHTDYIDVHDNMCLINGQAVAGQIGDWIEGHASAGSASHGQIHDEHFIVASGVWGNPIRGTGIIDDWNIHDNSFVCDGVTTSTLPLIEINGSGPTNIYIHDNKASNCLSPIAGSDRGLFKNGGTGGSLINNSCTGTCSSLVDYVGGAGTPQQAGDSVAGDASYAIASPTTFGSTVAITGTTTAAAINSGAITSTGSITAGAAGQLGWTGVGILTSPGAATIQLGAANAAVPVNQLLKVQGSRNGSDTDVGGANLTVASGAGTGTGTVSGITFSTPNLGTTGTTTQSYGARLTLNQGTAEVASGSTIDWEGRGIFTSPASGQIQLGNADAASPANQTLMTQGSRGGTDTNVAGANLSIQSGLGTGSATGSTLTLKTPKAGSTGTTAETAVNGLVLSDTAISVGNATSNPTFTFLGSGAISGTPVTSLLSTYAPLASPTFTGTPAAPTAATATNTTQLATTAFVTTASPRVIFQSGIPIGIPSSGTMGANGAVTLTTAMPIIYTRIFLYFPAGKVASGSAAGFYPTVMSSTTVGQVFNVASPLAGGALAWPGVLTAVVDAGPGAYTQDTAIKTAFTVSIPANVMGPNGSLTFEYLGSHNNSAGTKTPTVTWEATTVLSGALTTTLGLNMLRTFWNRSVTNAQIALANGTGNSFGTLTVAPALTAIDTTAITTFTFKLTLAVATDQIICEAARLVALYGA